MKLKDFKRKMIKPVFSVEEAMRVAFATNPNTLKLQLHQWTESGDLVRLKRGLYTFPDKQVSRTEIAKVLYSPCYISLEYALNFYAFLPDVVFQMTLVTPKTTRKLVTPSGLFIYHRIKPDLFWGFDPSTLMGEKEKVILDYLYLNSGRLHPLDDFWRQERWQNLETVDFRKALRWAPKFSKKTAVLVKSLRDYWGKNGST
ncbi:MAG: hypothetical protein Q7S00_04910 [bacterium]|nr:hypothetical protein [bacterium]